MHDLTRIDNLFMEDSVDSEPIVRLVFDNPTYEEQSLFGDEFTGSSPAVKLFPDESAIGDISHCQVEPDLADSNQAVIRLLPDNPSEEAVLRLRVQFLEVKLARQNAQIDFAERIDVDHLEWKRQKMRIQNLQAGNLLLIIMTCALLFGAGCMAVIK